MPTHRDCKPIQENPRPEPGKRGEPYKPTQRWLGYLMGIKSPMDGPVCEVDEGEGDAWGDFAVGPGGVEVACESIKASKTTPPPASHLFKVAWHLPNELVRNFNKPASIHMTLAQAQVAARAMLGYESYRCTLEKLGGPHVHEYGGWVRIFWHTQPIGGIEGYIPEFMLGILADHLWTHGWLGHPHEEHNDELLALSECFATTLDDLPSVIYAKRQPIEGGLDNIVCSHMPCPDGSAPAYVRRGLDTPTKYDYEVEDYFDDGQLTIRCVGPQLGSIGRHGVQEVLVRVGNREEASTICHLLNSAYLAGRVAAEKGAADK